LARTLLADSGAGTATSPFDLLLNESDCLACGAYSLSHVRLGGAYSGLFPLYTLRIQITALNFDDDVEVVGVSHMLSGLHGTAAFRFLNRFTYGNFGNSNQFGLER
jgi:ammonia channel protein AmtB